MSVGGYAGADLTGQPAFVSHLAHQLRTPLSLIVGYAELLRLRSDEALLREAPERILGAAETLSWLVDDVLTAFALEADLLVLDRTDVDLREGLDAAVEALRPLSLQTTFTWQDPSNGAWPVVSADETQLTRMLSRALVYGATVSPEDHVAVAVSSDDRSATIAVRPRGVSSDEATAALDEPASPVSVRSEVRTSGLELYQVRRLAELHGGTFSTVDEADRTASLAITIPLARPG